MILDETFWEKKKKGWERLRKEEGSRGRWRRRWGFEERNREWVEEEIERGGRAISAKCE